MQISFTHTEMPQTPDLSEGIAQAINETANEAREKAIEVVAGKYNVAPFAVRQAVAITYANASNLVAYLVFVGRRIALINFSPQQTATGVTAQIEIGKNKNYEHAFIRASKSGKLNVFIRIAAMSQQARAMAQKRKKRGLGVGQKMHGYPITTIKGISIPDMLAKSDVKAKVVEFIAAYMPQAMSKFIKLSS